MSSPDPIARLPYPLARVCAQLDDDTQSLQTRQEALYFAVYQLLRTLALPLLGQYLLGPKAGEAHKASADRLNKAIQRLRSPYFSDWVTVLGTLRKVAPQLGLDFLPRFEASMAAVERQSFDLPDADYGLEHGRRWQGLKPWDAFLALRNHTAHSGGRSDDVCRQDIAHFRPLLRALLAEFDWLGDYTLLALDADPDAGGFDETAAPVRMLRGPAVTLATPVDLEADAALAAAFADSPLVLRAPDGRVQALFPLGHGHLEGEPMHWFDGFYLSASDATALQALAAAQGQAGAAGPLPRLQRSVLYYLGCGRRVPLDDADAYTRVRVPPCDAAQRLRAHLDRHAVPWQLRRDDLAPWTIRDSVNDYSARTLVDLTGSKYFPQVYRERPDFDEALWDFCSAPVADSAPRALWLSGRAGTGKSALLCHLSQRLLVHAAQTQDLVFFLRGDGIRTDLLHGDLLFANFAQKIGLAHDDCAGFADLFSVLGQRRHSDKIEQRKLVIVLDALNEASEPRARLLEVLDLLSVLRNVPWVRLIVSVRSEFIDVWRSRREALAANPFHALRDLCLPPALVREADRSLPDWPLPEFDEAEAAAVYAAYQQHPDLRACRTPWERLAPGSRALLHRPLHLHLWMEAFDQREAPMPELNAADDLFEAWIDAQCKRFDQLEAGLQPLLAHVLAHGRSELDAVDDRALRELWEQTHTESERRRLDTPVQIAVAAGVLSARTLEEGSGYRFVFQRLGEQLLFRHLRRSAPDYAPAAVARWLACPASELLEGALARLAAELLRQDRASELAAFIVPGRETSARALDRALAGSLLQAPERTAVAVSAVLAALADVEQKLRFCRSLLWFIPERIEGLGRYDSHLPLYQAAATSLAALSAAEPQRSDLARDLSVSFIKLGDLHGALGHGAEALAFFEQARAIDERLAAAEPQRSDLVWDLVCSLVRAFQVSGVEPAASPHLQRALRLLSTLETEGRLPGKQAADGLQMLRQMLGAG